MTQTSTDALQRRNHELSILNSIAQALNRSVGIDEAVQTALAQAADWFDLQTGWVWLLHEKTGEPYLAVAQNLPPGLDNKPDIMEGMCYCLRTFREGDLDGAANVNVVECSRLQGVLDGTAGLRFHASIPLYAHGKQLGVLNVASTDWRRLSPDDLRLLHTIGDMLGIAIERARLFAQSTQLGALQERNRLAREIHDTLAQGLTAVSLQLESADALLEVGSSSVQIRQTIQHALDLTRANLDEARRSVMDLRAAPLEGKTLPDALTELVNNMTFPITSQVIGGTHPLPPRLEIGLYRIAQEALSNIGRHAQATQAELILIITPDTVNLTIVDDGQGFDPEAISPNRFGLIGMNERVKLLGGQLRLESSPGAGVRLEVTIPFR